MISKKKRALVLAVLISGLALLASCGNQGNTGNEVDGKLIDFCGQPLPYKTVYIPGHQPVLTNAEGEFSVPDVEAPYDLVVANASFVLTEMAGMPIVVFKGLTEAEPLIAVHDRGESSNDSCATATAKVTFSSDDSGSEYANAAALVLPPYLTSQRFSTGMSATLTLHFNPDMAGDGTLLGIQWKTDENSDATEFTGIKSETVKLEDGANITKDQFELDAKGITGQKLTLSVDAPEVYRLGVINNYLTIGDVTLSTSTATIQADEADDNGNYKLVVPVADGVGSMVEVSASYGGAVKSKSLSALGIESAKGKIYVWQKAPVGSKSMTVKFPEPLIPVAPLNGATLDPNEAVFSWTGHEGDLYDAIFLLGTNDLGFSVEVVTTDTSLQLPDLKSLGMLYDNVEYGRWGIFNIGGETSPGSIDAALSEEGFNLLFPILHELPARKDGYSSIVFAGGFTTPKAAEGDGEYH